jgi:hypothetical protein
LKAVCAGWAGSLMLGAAMLALYSPATRAARNARGEGGCAAAAQQAGGATPRHLKAPRRATSPYMLCGLKPFP